MKSKIMNAIAHLTPDPVFRLGNWEKPMEAVLDDTRPDATPEERQEVLFWIRFVRLATALVEERQTTKATVERIVDVVYDYHGENTMIEKYDCTTRAYCARELWLLTKRLAKAKK